jgi:hypothetical protein
MYKGALKEDKEVMELLAWDAEEVVMAVQVEAGLQAER